MAFLSSMVMMCLLRGGRGRQGSSPQRQAHEVSLPLLTRGNSPAPWIRQKHTVESWGSCSKIHMRIIIQIFTVRNLKAFMLAKGRCLSVPYSSKFWSTLFFKQNKCKDVVVVQLLSSVRLFATPWTTALQASLSFSISWSLLKLMS